ncbi:hypothetical protein EJB05_25958 [Eragrostis curvula]|uniref:Uncharacterized protein n=1 Tax=Eragrostis curvula TaxID=38414 RepID=A0A5J9UJD9_9POAL|nr:hypothetical protein EJB05_25958 [Eragrostis curvula]
MSGNSSEASDAVIDLEKGTAAVKSEEKGEKVAIVDPLKAMLINRFVDVVFVFYVMVFAGMFVYVAKVTNNSFWDLLETAVLGLPLMALTFWLISILRKGLLHVLANKGSMRCGCDLSTKLLASEK